GQVDFNALSMIFAIKGKGYNIKKLKAEFDGAVQNLQFNKYDYKGIKLSGNISEGLFKGLLVSNDTNANFDFNGTINFKNKIPEMDFISTINRLSLTNLHFVNRADSGVLSSQIFIKLNGDNLDNLTGQVNLDNTIYKTRKKDYKLSTFNILVDQSEAEKKIRLNSEYLNAMAYGQFNLSQLKPSFDAFLYYYYPNFFPKPTDGRKFSNQVTFQVKIKKFNAINELFLPDAMVSNGTVIDGNYNSPEMRFNIQFNSPKVSYKTYEAKDFMFILNESNNTVVAEASGKNLKISDSLNLENFNFAVKSKNTDLTYAFDWDNLKKPSNKGELKGEVSFTDSVISISNNKIAVTLNDSTWGLLKPSKLSLFKDGSLIVNHMEIVNNDQKIAASGGLSSKPGDSLSISVDNLVLQQFNQLLKIWNLKMEGVLNGDVILSNPDKNLTFKGDLTASQLRINDNSIGQVIVTSNYHTKEKYISLQGFTSLGVLDEFGNQAKNISFKGTYDLQKKDESIDIDFAAKPANLSLLNPLLEGILTINKGFVNGGGKVHGTPDRVKIDGKFRLFNSEIKVDYTNVTYNITGDIELLTDQIRFSDLNIREVDRGNRDKNSRSTQGTLNGNIFHDNFSKIKIDFDVNYNNMLVLNTSEKNNSSFYGRVYGTGNVGIWGYLNNLFMKIEATTNRNSKFYLPLDGPAEISENDFIQFVKKDTIGLKKEKGMSGFNLEMKLHATPEAAVQIIIDKKNGDVLNVEGQGDLRLYVNTLGKFEMYGDYVITDGDYLFTLENVINKKFDIDAGSSISWIGNPMGAEIDVNTSYKQRDSVAPLLNDTTGQYKSRT
ncbi:MAG: translocation/assembly module TamB domain-containing protein, partial [Bacteroidia bacterium]|nr:translocation/assembly module TamB domain-containing protein [Bacteroidia bacterium]